MKHSQRTISMKMLPRVRVVGAPGVPHSEQMNGPFVGAPRLLKRRQTAAAAMPMRAHSEWLSSTRASILNRVNDVHRAGRWPGVDIRASVDKLCRAAVRGLGIVDLLGPSL